MSSTSPRRRWPTAAPSRLSIDGAGHAAVLVTLGDALQEQGRLPDAERAYEEALPALRAAGDDHAAALAMVGLARAVWRHGQTARARELSREAIPILERQPGPGLLLAYERAAGEDTMGGRPNEGLAWAEKGIALAETLGAENVVRHLQFRGLARLELGDVTGLADMRDALDLSLRLGLGIETATSYGNLGESVTAFEGLAAGLELVEAGLDFSRRRGLTHHVMWSRTARLVYLYELGEWDELVSEADEVVRWDRDQGGSTQIEIWVLIWSVSVLAQRGNLDGASRDVDIFLPTRAGGRRSTDAAPGTRQRRARRRGERQSGSGGHPGDGVCADGWRVGKLFHPLLPTVLRVCVAAGELALAESLVDGTAEAADSQLLLSSKTSARAILAEAHGQTDEAAASMPRLQLRGTSGAPSLSAAMRYSASASGAAVTRICCPRGRRFCTRLPDDRLSSFGRRCRRLHDLPRSKIASAT